MPIHAEDLRRFLAEATGKPIELRINDNWTSMITARPSGAGIKVSLHRMFLEADEPVIDAVARFVFKPSDESRSVIRDYISNNHALIAPSRASAPRRVIRGASRGDRWNLAERAAHFNRTFFDSGLRFRIIWGREARGGRRQRHVTLGTWNPRQHIIRIHPMLDMPGVPDYFIDFIIFHEMAHIVVPAYEDDGRRQIHTPEFYAVEARYPHIRRAKRWEQRWLTAMLRAWNGGAPIPAQADDSLGEALTVPAPVAKPKPAPIRKPPKAEPPPDESGGGQLTLF